LHSIQYSKKYSGRRLLVLIGAILLFFLCTPLSATADEQTFFCQHRNGEFRPFDTLRNGRVVPLRRKTRRLVNRIARRLQAVDANRSINVRRARNIRRRLQQRRRSLRQNLRSAIATCRVHQECLAIPQTGSLLQVVGDENSPIKFSLADIHPDLCFTDTEIRILSHPSHGTVSVLGTEIEFVPKTHYIGSDSFQFVVRAGSEEGPAETVAITISKRQDEFSGVAGSLEPYRSQLTDREADRLLETFGLGGTPHLRSIRNRAELVEALLSGSDEPNNFVPQQDASAYGIPGSCSTAAKIAYMEKLEEQCAGQEESKACLTARAFQIGTVQKKCVSSPHYMLIWQQSAAQDYWMTQLLYGDPLQERMGLLFHDHFAVNLLGDNPLISLQRHHWLPLHIDGLRRNSVKSFEDLIRMFTYSAKGEYERPSSYLGFNQYFDGMQWSTPDGAMAWWLDSMRNPKDNPNENFGREFLELMILGTVDPYLEASPGEPLPNYTENDMQMVSRTFTGFYDRNLSSPHLNSSYTYLRHEDQNWDSSSKKFFEDTPWEAQAAFKPKDLTDYILFSHGRQRFGDRYATPARYISHKLFSRTIFPHPAEHVTDQLAS